VWTEVLRKFLREEYGENFENWKTSLNRMLKNIHLNPVASYMLHAIQTVLKEVNERRD